MKRKNPFLDQHYSMASFYKTLLVVNPAMFLITFIVNLRGANDLKSYCNDDGIKPEALPFVRSQDPMMQLFSSV